MKIGAQLYTVRDFTKTPEALSDTLKRIADIGYSVVQISGTCPFNAEWMKTELEKNGLTAPLIHHGMEGLIKETDNIVSDAKIFGCNTVGLGYCPFDEFGENGFEQRVMPFAKRINELGLKFAFHNHDNEFGKRDSKKIIFDELLDRFPPELMGIILDVYWVQRGGGDPISWIYKLEGRTEHIHLKDMQVKQKMSVVGEGNMNFDGILKAAVDTGVHYGYVEQDDCNGEDPFECLKRSYEFLKAKGFN